MGEVEAFLDDYAGKGRVNFSKKKNESEPRFYFKVMGYFACLAYRSNVESQSKVEDH